MAVHERYEPDVLLSPAKILILDEPANDSDMRETLRKGTQRPGDVGSVPTETKWRAHGFGIEICQQS